MGLAPELGNDTVPGPRSGSSTLECWWPRHTCIEQSQVLLCERWRCVAAVTPVAPTWVGLSFQQSWPQMGFRLPSCVDGVILVVALQGQVLVITSVWAFLMLHLELSPSHLCSLPNLLASVSHFARLPGPAALLCGLDDSLHKLLARSLENKPHPGLMICYSISLLERRPWGPAPGSGVCPPHSCSCLTLVLLCGWSALQPAEQRSPLAVGWRGGQADSRTKGQRDCWCQHLSSLVTHNTLDFFGAWCRTFLDLWARLGLGLLSCTLDSFCKEIRDKK